VEGCLGCWHMVSHIFKMHPCLWEPAFVAAFRETVFHIFNIFVQKCGSEKEVLGAGS